MEKILGRGGEKNFDINSISRELGIEARLVEKYIDLLMDKRKIVSSKGKEGGVFIHESLVENAKAALLKLKKRGKRFTVKDFREITGYTHQSAIPILELLDYMGLTRRVGDEREVLL
ncbi:MAG TPA: SelB C-terminal domain-containing protein [Candidatus Aminicenantes bacterium]|nr:SelB C-terminal domain-containing protein [Candidatus Aminicenantes bacterium]